MKKKLILEINRYRELMGLNDNLILEQSFAVEALEKASQFVSKLMRDLDSGKGTIRNRRGPAVVSNVKLDTVSQIDELIDVLDDPKKLDSLSDELKIKLSKLLLNNKELIQSFYDNFISSLSKQKISPFDLFESMFSSGVPNQMKMEDFLRNKFGWGEFEIGILKDKLSNELKTHIDKSKSMRVLAGKTISEVNGLTQEQINKLAKIYNPTRGGFQSLKAAFIHLYDFLYQYVLGSEKIINETMIIIKTMQSELQKGRPNQDEMNSLYNKVLENLQLLSSEKKQHAINLKTWIDTNIQDDNIRKQILDGNDVGKTLEKLLEKNKFDDWYNKYGTMSERRWDMINQFLTKVVWPGSWYGKTFNEVWRTGDQSWATGVLKKLKAISWGSSEKIKDTGRIAQKGDVSQFGTYYRFGHTISTEAKESLLKDCDVSLPQYYLKFVIPEQLWGIVTFFALSAALGFLKNLVSNSIVDTIPKGFVAPWPLTGIQTDLTENAIDYIKSKPQLFTKEEIETDQKDAVQQIMESGKILLETAGVIERGEIKFTLPGHLIDSILDIMKKASNAHLTEPKTLPQLERELEEAKKKADEGVENVRRQIEDIPNQVESQSTTPSNSNQSITGSEYAR